MLIVEPEGRRTYDAVMTVKDVCEYFAIGKNHVYQLIKDHRIKAFRMGRRYKIPKESVENFVRENCA